MQKCPECGKLFCKYPVLKDQSLGWRKGNINYMNLIKMDVYSLWIILSILAILIGFKTTYDRCEVAINSPCEWCADNGCCDNVYTRPQEPVYFINKTFDFDTTIM